MNLSLGRRRRGNCCGRTARLQGRRGEAENLDVAWCSWAGPEGGRSGPVDELVAPCERPNTFAVPGPVAC